MTFKMIMPFFNAETDEGGNTGVTVPDAEVQDDVVDDVQDDSVEDVQDDTVSDDVSDDTVDDNIPDLPPEQKTAFQKRLEREQRKIREQLEQELKSQYSKHDQIIQLLGGDVETIEKAIKEQQWAQEAEAYGYDRDAYVREKQREDRLFELEIRDQINELRDNPDYAGIQSMKKEVADMVKRSNGALTVEQAYWALGGKMRAEQVKREVEQRQIAKRKQAKFSPQSDSSSASVPTSPFSAEELAAIKQMGLTVEEAQELMKTPSDLYEFRKQRKKK